VYVELPVKGPHDRRGADISVFSNKLLGGLALVGLSVRAVWRDVLAAQAGEATVGSLELTVTARTN